MYNTRLFPVNHHHHRQQLYQQPPKKFIQINAAPDEKHGPLPPINYQYPQQIPLIYENQHIQPLSYFHQQPTPHEVIYHQQPIVSMAEFQSNPTFLPTVSPPHVSINGNIDPQVSVVEQQQESSNTDVVEIAPEEIQIQPQFELLKVDVKSSTVATPNQLNAKSQDDAEKAQQDEQFNSPIVVGDEGKVQNDETIVVQQKNKVFENYQTHHQPQINVQILTDTKSDGVEVTQPTTLINGHTNNNNYQYLVEDQDQDILDSTQSSQKEAPSRQFLRNFNFNSNAHSSTTVRTTETSTSRGCCRVDIAGKMKCCDEADKVKVTTQTASNNLLAPVHAGLRLTNEKLEDCIDGHPDKIVEVHKEVNVKQTFVTSTRKPSYGERIVSERAKIVSPPPIVIEKEFQRPVYVSTPSPVSFMKILCKKV